MDSALVASSTNTLIDSFQDILSSNLGLVLTFAAGIIVWAILKKWVFGGAHRV